ncbi:DoxX-like protein [Kribbella sp. VKM Ac-2527]|uniref:DoxX-like protein n=1 Tax=Kribbella caucasensis TaxID=2512215 RepID=A0A4R6K8Z7_9ACTN|nr:DoxX family protein [Kribbella sp. VKM Ac-2527]TDO44937.1 DoxX-like protein [Kribbella sp. VKM Ac-2527]
MSDTTVTMRKVRPATVGLWVVQVLLAEFVSAGLMKLSGSAVMVEMFAEIGIGQWFRYLVGALEVAGAIGVLVPRLSGLAALGLAGVMVGAVVTTVFVLGASPAVPFGFLLLAGLVAWARRAAIRELAGKGHAPAVQGSALR